MFLFLGFVFRFHCTRVECWNFLSFFFLISYLVFRLHGIDAAAKTKKWRVFFEKKNEKKDGNDGVDIVDAVEFFFLAFSFAFLFATPFTSEMDVQLEEIGNLPKKGSLHFTRRRHTRPAFYRVLPSSLCRIFSVGYVRFG